MNNQNEDKKSNEQTEPKVWEIFGIIAFGIILIKVAMNLF